jgi:hypothetical protein
MRPRCKEWWAVVLPRSLLVTGVVAAMGGRKDWIGDPLCEPVFGLPFRGSLTFPSRGVFQTVVESQMPLLEPSSVGRVFTAAVRELVVMES